jgi:hypothetical protein
VADRRREGMAPDGRETAQAGAFLAGIVGGATGMMLAVTVMADAVAAVV